MPQDPAPMAVPPTGFDRRGKGLRATAGMTKQAVRARQLEFSVGVEETLLSWMNMGCECKQRIWI